MITKDTMIKVKNKFGGIVGYDVPDTNLHRNYYPNQTREVTYDELEKVFYSPGGEVILRDYLEIENEEAIQKLFESNVEPEYHYSRDDIKQLMLTGSMDQFLDCLDFSPAVTRDIIKDMAVELPLNDMAKREAIQEKLGFNVTRAIEIKNTKYDGETEEAENINSTAKRRTAPVVKKAKTAETGRRYKPVTKK